MHHRIQAAQFGLFLLVLLIRDGVDVDVQDVAVLALPPGARELVRDLRSSLGYIPGDFQCLPLDCGSAEFDAFLEAQSPYNYVLNLSALKHVRSEKDPYTLMRMIVVNILNTENQCFRSTAQQTTIKNYLSIGGKNQTSRNRF